MEERPQRSYFRRWSTRKGRRQTTRGFPPLLHWVDADVPTLSRSLQAPRHSAIGRFVKTVGGRSVEYRRSLGIDDEIVEAHSDKRRRCRHSPCCATIGGFVNAGAKIVIEIPFAASGIDFFRICRIEGNGTNGEGRHLIGARVPGRPRVGAFPNATAGGA